MVTPFRPGTSTPTISSLNLSASIAASDFRWDSSEKASASSREIPARAAVYSAWPPM